LVWQIQNIPVGAKNPVHLTKAGFGISFPALVSDGRGGSPGIFDLRFAICDFEQRAKKGSLTI
jgi:hypothetical protein